MKKDIRLTAALIKKSALLLCLSGCEEKNKVEDGSTRKARLIAAENMQLKNTIEEMQEQLKEQKKLLADCKEKKEELRQQSAQNVGKAMDIFQDMTEKIQEENKQLKAELKRLKGQDK